MFMADCSFLTPPSAGADKKAEAGAGAATEFQFVSTEHIYPLGEVHSVHLSAYKQTFDFE